MAKSTTGKNATSTKRLPSAAEGAAIAAAREKFEQMPVRPEMELSMKEGGTVAALDAIHSDGSGHAAMLHEAVGSSSNGWLNLVMVDLLKLAKSRGQEEITPESASAAMAFMAAVQPENEVEAALGAQMFATHQIAMEMASRCRHTTDRVATMEYGNLATKMMRTFSGQVEALSKIRRGGEQVVRHVHVYEGGQAVVADQFHHYGANGNGKSLGQPYAPFAGHPPSGGPAMLGQDTAGNGVPVSSDQRQTTVSHARRPKPRRTTREQA